MVIEIKDACNEFWDYVEDITGFSVPAYLRNILKLNGFDRAETVELIEEEDFTIIDSFAKSGEMQSILPVDANLSDFYGPFINLKHFRILQGHRKMLLKISVLIREKKLQYISTQAITRSTECNTTHDEEIETLFPVSENNNFTMNSNSTMMPYTSPITTTSMNTTRMVKNNVTSISDCRKREYLKSHVPSKPDLEPWKRQRKVDEETQRHRQMQHNVSTQTYPRYTYYDEKRKTIYPSSSKLCPRISVRRNCSYYESPITKEALNN